MTMQEAIEQKIPRLRQEAWSPDVYVDLVYTPDGTVESALLQGVTTHPLRVSVREDTISSWLPCASPPFLSGPPPRTPPGDRK